MLKFGMRSFVMLMAVFISVPAGLWAHDMASMSDKKMPAGFERLKGLVGTWTGMKEMGGKKMEVTMTYAMTAGGSAIVETLFKGTPHEMTSVYYTKGDKVCMTHYCMLGNRPEMTLKKSGDDSLAFEMLGNEGVSSANDPHMHGMTVTWVGKDHIKTEWLEYVEGKKSEVVDFDFKRKN